jgi:hypothetical protein
VKQSVAGCSPPAFFVGFVWTQTYLALSSVCGQASFGRFDPIAVLCLVLLTFGKPDAPPVVDLWCALNKI